MATHGESNKRRWFSRALAAFFLLGLGGFLAFFLFDAGGRFFSWSRPTPYTTLIATLVGSLGALLAASWLFAFARRVGWRPGLAALTAASLVYVGFAGGLWGPAILGERASFDTDRLGSSTIYDFEFEYIDLPRDLARFSVWRAPGPSLAEGPGQSIWVAVNSARPPKLEDQTEALAYEGSVGLWLWSEAETGSLTDWINLTDVDSRIQHVRDIAGREGGLFLTNIQVKKNCLVLQLWTLEIDETLEIGALEPIWESSPCLTPDMSPELWVDGLQSGARLQPEPGGTILLSVGDFRTGLSVDQDYEGRPFALGPDASYGKIWRVHPGGEATLVSSGHRNPQGLFLDSSSGQIWATEHGPKGGGELNLIKAGRDYGWPDVTYGAPYGPNLPDAGWDAGTRWSSHHDGFEKPVLAWLPSIAPGQLAVYRGTTFPAWNGDLLVSGMKERAIFRVRLDGERAVFQERIEIGERVRDMVALQDGRLLLSFDRARLGVVSSAD